MAPKLRKSIFLVTSERLLIAWRITLRLAVPLINSLCTQKHEFNGAIYHQPKKDHWHDRSFTVVV